MLTLDDFTADVSGGSYSASIDLDDQVVTVRLIGKQKEAFSFVDFNALLQLPAAVTNDVAADLLPDKNSQWLKEGESPVDERHFIRRLKPEAVHVYPDRTMRIYYNDSGMFWGHTVVAGISAEGNFAYATLEG